MNIEPIAYIRNDFTEKFGIPRQAGLADKVCAFIAPMMVGGKNATPAVGGEGFSRLADAARLTDIKTEMVGKDLCVSGYIVKE